MAAQENDRSLEQFEPLDTEHVTKPVSTEIVDTNDNNRGQTHFEDPDFNQEELNKHPNT